MNAKDCWITILAILTTFVMLILFLTFLLGVPLYGVLR